MTKILKVVTWAVALLCTATVISQLVIAALLWMNGGLSIERRAQIVAVMYEADDADASSDEDTGSESSVAAPTSHVLIDRARIDQTPSIVARRDAINKTLKQLELLSGTLEGKRERNELRRADMEKHLALLEEQTLEASRVELQLTLEAMKPKQAKTHLVHILDDDAMSDVVAMIKAMTLDRRKKILGEFKSDAEAALLHEILREIREEEDSNGAEQVARKP